jgi:BASS family bile acid:Na+ symporter
MKRTAASDSASGLLTGAGLVSAIVAGLCIPSAEILRPALPFLLGSLLFFSFVKMDIRETLGSVLNRGMILFPVVVWGILPPLVLWLGRSMETDLRAGLFLIAVTPPALGAPVIVEILRGDRKTVLSNVVVFNLLSPFAFAGLLAVWMHSVNGAAEQVPVWAILGKMVLLIGIPFLIALGIRQVRILKAASILAAPWAAPAGLVLVVFTACASASRKIQELPFGTIAGVFGIVLALCLLLYGLGFLFGSTRPVRTALAIATGQKNTSLTVWIALSTFAPLAAVPAVLYIVCHHLVSAFLILAASFRKKR